MAFIKLFEDVSFYTCFAKFSQLLNYFWTRHGSSTDAETIDPSTKTKLLGLMRVIERLEIPLLDKDRCLALLLSCGVCDTSQLPEYRYVYPSRVQQWALQYG